MQTRGERIRSRARWYERARFEDNPFPPWRVDRWPGYLAKFWLKRRSAPAAVVRHFDAVRRQSSAARVPPADFTLTAVGDILWMRRGWEDFISGPVAEALRADLVFGNLETPVCPSRPVRERVPDLLRFNAPPALLDTLARGGFDVLSAVNNHSLDQGADGWRETLAEVRRRGLAAIEPGRCEVVERCGLRVAFLAFTTVMNPRRGLAPPAGAVVGPAGRGVPAFLDAVRNARGAGSDLVVVSAHWGHEHEFFPDRRQVRLARAIVAAGADVVLGHHPHIIQPAEFIRVGDRLGRTAAVCYSLANFVSVLFTLPCRVGVVARLGFALGPGRPRVTSVEFVPTIVHIRKRLRTQVLRLDSAAAGVTPARIRRAHALVEAQTPLCLVPP